MRSVGRPANTDPEETKARVLSAAIELFGRYGEEGASVRQVARAADVSLSTVMHHFGNKEGLYQACLDAIYTKMAAIRDDFGEVLTKSSSPREILRDISRTALEFGFLHRKMLRVVIAAAVGTGRTPEAIFEKFTAPTLDKVGGLIAKLTGRPEAQMRLLTLSINHALSRYVLTDPIELARVVNPNRTDVADTDEVDTETFEALVEHFAQMIYGMAFAPNLPA